MKKILLIATGGTIASVHSKYGLAPGISPEQLLNGIPEIKDFCYADTIQILNIDSSNIQPEDWLLIGDAIKSHYDKYDGFVITHGTDTMAYTASALSYLIQNLDKPVAVTGSQKPINQLLTDAKRNLKDAFRFCCATPSSKGIFIVFGGIAIFGTRATKNKTKSYDAFESINFPIAAYIDEMRVASYIQPQIKNEAPLFYSKIAPEVFLLKLIPGIEPDILDYVSNKYDAIVIEGYGMGGLPFADRRNFLRQVEKLASQDKIVVIATQVKHEGSDLSVYETGVKAFSSFPLLQSFDMTVESVVTKLMWILSVTRRFDEVEKLFYTPINNDLSIFPENFK